MQISSSYKRTPIILSDMAAICKELAVLNLIKDTRRRDKRSDYIVEFNEHDENFALGGERRLMLVFELCPHGELFGQSLFDLIDIITCVLRLCASAFYCCRFRVLVVWAAGRELSSLIFPPNGSRSVLSLRSASDSIFLIQKLSIPMTHLDCISWLLPNFLSLLSFEGREGRVVFI
jgi:hypothetical protein